MDTWALFSKKNGQWEFKGFTGHEELVSEFEDELGGDFDEEAGEVRISICLEDFVRGEDGKTPAENAFSSLLREVVPSNSLQEG